MTNRVKEIIMEIFMWLSFLAIYTIVILLAATAMVYYLVSKGT
jgi:hypothetical protein